MQGFWGWMPRTLHLFYHEKPDNVGITIVSLNKMMSGGNIRSGNSTIFSGLQIDFHYISCTKHINQLAAKTAWLKTFFCSAIPNYYKI